MSKLIITLDASETEFLHLFDKLPVLGTWSVVKRLETNLLRVMLALDDDQFSDARSMAERGEYLGLEDYINDEVLTVLTECEDANR